MQHTLQDMQNICIYMYIYVYIYYIYIYSTYKQQTRKQPGRRRAAAGLEAPTGPGASPPGPEPACRPGSQLFCVQTFGLFWYRRHPEIHEMVSDGSSQAENWTDSRKISVRVLFWFEKIENMFKKCLTY